MLASLARFSYRRRWLVIIVMLVAPLVQQGVSLTLPVARNTTDHPETSDQTTVAITRD